MQEEKKEGKKNKKILIRTRVSEAQYFRLLHLQKQLRSEWQDLLNTVYERALDLLEKEIEELKLKEEQNKPVPEKPEFEKWIICE